MKNPCERRIETPGFISHGVSLLLLLLSLRLLLLEKSRSAFNILTDKPTGKRHLGKSRSRWKDNIRKGLKKIGVSMRNWGDSAQYREKHIFRILEI